MEPIVVASYTHRSGYMDVLEDQLNDAGIEFHFEKMRGEFTWKSMMLSELDLAKRFHDRLIIIVGAWDTILFGSKEEIQGLEIGGFPLSYGITLGSDKAPWPHIWRTGFPETGTRWRYLNTGPTAGMGATIAEAMEWGLGRFPMEGSTRFGDSPDGTDMKFFTDLYLDEEARAKFGIRVDSECKLCQLFCSFNIEDEGDFKEGRLINKITGSKPIFLHANGRRKIPEEWYKHWEYVIDKTWFEHEKSPEQIRREEFIKQKSIQKANLARHAKLFNENFPALAPARIMARVYGHGICGFLAKVWSAEEDNGYLLLTLNPERERSFRTHGVSTLKNVATEIPQIIGNPYEVEIVKITEGERSVLNAIL